MELLLINDLQEGSTLSLCGEKKASPVPSTYLPPCDTSKEGLAFVYRMQALGIRFSAAYGNSRFLSVGDEKENLLVHKHGFDLGALSVGSQST